MKFYYDNLEFQDWDESDDNKRLITSCQNG